jgi:hypothetical protein
VTRRLLIPAVLLLLLSCARLPHITPQAGAPPPEFCKEASSLFPKGKWQFLHSISAEMPGGRNFMMMGLTVMSSQRRTVRSVIMTLEGFVVFDGEYDEHLTVHRALPPFDSPHFAEGLMEDIRLIFFAPDGPLVASGVSDNGSVVCRHEMEGGSTIDIESLADHGWELKRYGPSHQLLRTVRVLPGEKVISGFPERMELIASGGHSYKLIMKLLEAVPIEP